MKSQPDASTTAIDLVRVIEQTRTAFTAHVSGDPEAYIALWSQRDDVAVLGAAGSVAAGFSSVQAHLRAAAKTLHWQRVHYEPVTSFTSEALAVIVALEHMRRDEGPQQDMRTLRSTQTFRLESGKWRLVLRHANTLTDADADTRQEAVMLG